MKTLTLLALCLLAPAAFAETDKAPVSASCLLADQTTGELLALKNVELEEVQLDVAIAKSARGYAYSIGRTTAGSDSNLQHLLFLSIRKHGKVISQTGVTIQPGQDFNVMLTAAPQAETITCSGK